MVSTLVHERLIFLVDRSLISLGNANSITLSGSWHLKFLYPDISCDDGNSEELFSFTSSHQASFLRVFVWPAYPSLVEKNLFSCHVGPVGCTDSDRVPFFVKVFVIVL